MSNAFEIDSFFNQVFDRITKTLEFNPDWANGTGYLDGAAEGPDTPMLASGEMVKSTDNFGRPMIIIGLPVGNLVVFRRYSKESGIYTYNASREFDRHWMGTYCQGKQSLEDLKAFFGEWSDSKNIGQLMDSTMTQKKTETNIDPQDKKIDEYNNATRAVEAWIANNVSPWQQDELRTLIAAYASASASMRSS